MALHVPMCAPRGPREAAEEAPYELYRGAIEVAARWGVLAAIARRVYEDGRLSDREREDLFNLVDVREMAVRPGLTREPSG